ncbi:MAG: hypothetical protein Q8M08_09980 [Bacteroidales bacterium]|nr:hypothetical protein [Bacteroidales bacterium]
MELSEKMLVDAGFVIVRSEKAAYLIIDPKVIQNPYLGSKMPTCGEVKEEL